MKLSDVVANWHPAQWDDFLLSYGIPKECLSGKPCPCPVCGGTDRFTYDNHNGRKMRGRGNWICRKCDGGNAVAGDGIELVMRFTGMSYTALAQDVEGGANRTPAPARKIVRPTTQPNTVDSAKAAARLDRKWTFASAHKHGDHCWQYLEHRVPGLDVRPSSALRLAHLDYWIEGATPGKYDSLGRFPVMLAKLTLPDGRMANLHRTYLDPVKPAKATIISLDGEVLDAKKNEVAALIATGGAVRLMDPVGGVIGVSEGIETAYAAHMLFGVPAWSCLNRGLLSKFVVPGGLGIHTVHIFADFDQRNSKTGQSDGMVSALELQRRLRSEGFTAVLHRPAIRGTDFCDEWLHRGSKFQVSQVRRAFA